MFFIFPGNSSWIPPPSSTSLLFSPSLRQLELPTSQNVWLFNITADPEERHDLSKNRPEDVVRLLHRLAAYNSTAVPCRFPKGDPKANPKLHGNVWGPWE